MYDEFTQFWLQRNLNEIGKRAALEAIDNLGKSLPCTIKSVTGQIVTVAFLYANTAPFTLPDLTVPVDSSAYDYVPYQPGDTGVVRPTDIYIGNISGLGSPTPTNTKAPNLSALVFTPVGKKSFAAANPNARIIQGPDGGIMQTTQGTPSSVVTNQSGTTITFGNSVLVVEDGQISMTAGGQTVIVNSSGISIGGILFGTHTHPYLPGTGAQTETGNPQ
ncbi:hypothetical protein [Acidithiobacillus sp.]|uniref:hypothetical protein n=1 Tax=Acidithiobacillus sp. TaxID=1872118 RepID=UPI003CFEA533